MKKRIGILKPTWCECCGEIVGYKNLSLMNTIYQCPTCIEKELNEMNEYFKTGDEK